MAGLHDRRFAAQVVIAIALCFHGTLIAAPSDKEAGRWTLGYEFDGSGTGWFKARGQVEFAVAQEQTAVEVSGPLTVEGTNIPKTQGTLIVRGTTQNGIFTFEPDCKLMVSLYGLTAPLDLFDAEQSISIPLVEGARGVFASSGQVTWKVAGVAKGKCWRHELADAFHGHSRLQLARGPGTAGADLCAEVRRRIIEERFTQEIFANPHINDHARAFCLTVKDMQKLAADLWNVVFSDDVSLMLKMQRHPKSGGIKLREYMDSLSPQEREELLAETRSEPVGGTKIQVAMETDWFNCLVRVVGPPHNPITYYKPNTATDHYATAEQRKEAEAAKTRAERFYQDREGKYLGKVFFDADFAHERKHVDDHCGKTTKISVGDLLRFETEAYDASALHLERWAKKNCP